MKEREYPAVVFAAGMALVLIIAVGVWGASPPDATTEDLPQGPNAPLAVSAPANAMFKARLPVFLLSSGNCTTAPLLLSPANGSDNASLCPLFAWDAGSNPFATYMHVLIATDPAFESIFTSVGTSGQGPSSYRLGDNLTPGTTYYWRAYILCGSELGPRSATWSFTTAASGVIPPAPSLVAPINGTALSSLPATLEWTAVPGATAYFVRWQRPGLSTGGQWTAQTQLSVGWLTRGAEYVWWVQALGDYALSPESERWRFTTPAAECVLENP